MYFVSEIGAETLEFSKNRRLPKTACFCYRTKRPARSQLFPVFVMILSIFIQKRGAGLPPFSVHKPAICCILHIRRRIRTKGSKEGAGSSKADVDKTDKTVLGNNKADKRAV